MKHLAKTLLLASGLAIGTPQAAPMPKILANEAQDNPIYLLLVAELAHNRGNALIAMQYYLKAAKLTKQPRYAELATNLAIQLQDAANAIEASKLWALLQPDNLPAQLVTITLMLGSPEDATPFISNASAINANELAKQLAAMQPKLNPHSRKNLTAILSKLASDFPNNLPLVLLAANNNALENNMALADTLVEQVLSKAPENSEAIQLKAKLIRASDNNDTKALAFLRDKLKEFPSEHNLRLFYSNALLDSNLVNEAEEQLMQLKDIANFSGEAYTLLSSIAYNRQDYGASKNYLLLAEKIEQYTQASRFLLAQLAEDRKNIPEALSWYLKVNASEYHIPATLQAVAILTEANKLAEALEVLQNSNPQTLNDQKDIAITEVELLLALNESTRALDLANSLVQDLPNDIDVLFTHSLAASRNNQWKLAEQDLRKIITIEPNNHDAVNALSYSISMQNDKSRLEEAYKYAKAALSANPDHPSYLDTMGWVLYKMNKLTEAKTHLQKAIALSNDPEIFAHYGEVLWVKGDKDQAINIWQEGINSYPNNDELLAVINRFNVNSKLNNLANIP